MLKTLWLGIFAATLLWSGIHPKDYYVWDTQSDMALALLGAVVALVVLGRWHDRQLRDVIR